MIWRRLLAGVCGAICHRQKVPNACGGTVFSLSVGEPIR